jgi:hypothetical protein
MVFCDLRDADTVRDIDWAELAEDIDITAILERNAL